ncbi:MAG TPA: hypothetical protein PLO37_17920 [Candidatus Hydrogenedentes bacterium]|nr:hypothetical protein [Candidatus Hydrogenedentota bacterium]HPG68728.1 hypothetical protein [Candidatus Hydrogenedentota bacterium]
MITTLTLACMICAEPVDIGQRRELFVDTALIDSMSNVALQLHEPVPREVALVLDAPWEGNSCGYFTVFQDGDVYRMYYRGGSQTLKDEPPTHEYTTCYAESADGAHWAKPELGLVEFEGSKANNILWMGEASHNFVPFKDTNPACTPEARYKAVALEAGGLSPFQSADGIHWTRLREAPILTQGAFDSQNLVFWDTVRGEYRAYWRDFRDGRRDIKTSVSNDFLTWSDPAWLTYPGAPDEQLYTNQVIPYFRAPHILLGFPTRYIDRGWSDSMRALPELEHRLKRSETSAREGTALTDGLFMSSRDGITFHRWDRAFIRPGLRTAGNWVYGDNYQAWGIIETRSAIEDAPGELSIFATEGYWTGSSCRLRRFTLRTDGFVSVSAPLSGGELVTKPLVFSGDKLALNFSTSAAGSIRIEIQHADGTPIPGFTLADAPEIFGDALDQVVSWKDNRTLADLQGTPVRLRFELKDADLYAFHFE